MKKLTTNSKLIGCLMGLSIVALGTGCTDSDYDLSSVDSTIGVGGEGLELPTSSTENIILDDVLKLNNSDFVKIAANGDYMFNKDGDEATPSHPYINKIWVEKANVNNNFRLHITLPSQSVGARRTKLSNPVTAEGKLAEFHYTGAASNDIRELKRGQCVVRRGDQRDRQCRFEACGEDLQDPQAHRTLLYAPRPAPVLTLPARLRCGHGCSDISQREQHGQHQAPCRSQDLGLPEARHDGQQAALHAGTGWQGWSSGPQWRAECGYLFRRGRLCPERWRPLPLSQYVDGIHHGA